MNTHQESLTITRTNLREEVNVKEGLNAIEIKTHKAHEPNFKKAREFISSTE